MKAWTCILLCFLTLQLNGQSVGLQGQASLWAVMNNREQSQAGLRYIPDLSVETSLSEKWMLDSELACQAAQWWNFDVLKYRTEDNKLKPYRLWLRLSADQFEARLGLQKINFGSARLLRPLMWFDRLDPRDPLQLTEGVYGLLFRYTFLNNANIWAWALYGNDALKGYEVLASKKKRPEYGGRIQIPVKSGEMALSFHHREVEIIDASENRVAVDGRWDIEIGLWFEVAMTHLRPEIIPEYVQTLGTLGMDYTIGLGNGLFCQAEHFTLQVSEDWFGPGTTRKLTAVSLNYPFGLMDNLSSILYYDWDTKDLYRYIDWQRTYDSWQIHLIGFWNPDRIQLIQFGSDPSLWVGKGIQLMIVFNH